MSYRMTYFRINTEGYMPGWVNEAASDRFHAECRDLFQTAGWEVHPGYNGACDTVTKGNLDLYLHPQSFGGVILDSEVQPIRELLAKATTFQCYHVDFYEEYLDINDEEYRALLEAKRDEITAAIIKHCQTKRSNLYIVGPVALDIAEEFSVRRVCDKENHHNEAVRFFIRRTLPILDCVDYNKAAYRPGPACERKNKFWRWDKSCHRKRKKSARISPAAA